MANAIIDIQQFISSVQRKVSSDSFRELYRSSPISFTRIRKLSFSHVYSFILSCPQKSSLTVWITSLTPLAGGESCMYPSRRSQRHASIFTLALLRDFPFFLPHPPQAGMAMARILCKGR